MKKQISLFLSALLILTTVFSGSVFASSDIQIKPKTAVMDLANSETVTFIYSNGPYKIAVDGNENVGQITNASSRTMVSVDGYDNVLKFTRSGTKYPYISLYPLDESGERIAFSDGIFALSAKIYSSDDFTDLKRHFRIYPQEGSSKAKELKLYTDTDAYKWLPDTWYDVKWTIDVKNESGSKNNVSFVATPQLSADSSAETETRTIKHEYNYSLDNISYLRIDLGTVNAADQYVYMADFKTCHYKEDTVTYDKAEILSVGDNGEVMYNQNNISLKLSADIPGIDARDISIITENEDVVEVADVSITSDGIDYIANITTAYPLAAQTDYYLTILARAWGGCSSQIENGIESDVTDVTAEFYTPVAPIQIKPCTVVADLESAQNIKLSYENGSSKIMVDDVAVGQVASTSTTLQSLAETFEGYNNVLKVSKNSSKNPYISIAPKGKDGESFKEGKYIFKAKIRSNEALDSSKRVFRIVGTGESSAGVYVSVCNDDDSVTWIPNTWYDTEWIIDMDKSSSNVSLVFTPEIPGATADEIASKTISHTYSYNKSDISYLRIDLLPATAGSGEVCYANFAHMSSSDEAYYNKAEIVSAGEDGEVMYNQNEIPLVLSYDIPSLALRHFSLTDTEGIAVELESFTKTENGKGYDVIIKTKEPLVGWTDYKLSIKASAWGPGSTQIDNGVESKVTDLTAPLYTPSAPLDIKKPVFSLEGDKLCVDTAIINTTSSPVDVTLSVVVYDADGRVKSVNPVSYPNFKSGNSGAEKHLEVSFSDGDTAKIMAINGWEKMTSLFGKYWSVSYDELN